MKDKEVGAVTIIGGADGPTSVVVISDSNKKSIKAAVKQEIYRHKRKKAEKKIVKKKIVANAHTIEETITYAIEKYHAIDVSATYSDYEEQLKNLKESLVITKKADVADEVQTDFHIFEIKTEGGELQIEVDFIWERFGISYSGNRKAMKMLDKICLDLYLYYGVSEEDIRDKTKRYSTLLTMMAE